MKTKQVQQDEASTTPYLRRAQAAQLLTISLGTLDGWIKNGTLAVIRPSPRTVLLRRSDIETAMERYRVEAVGE